MWMKNHPVKKTWLKNFSIDGTNKYFRIDICNTNTVFFTEKCFLAPNEFPNPILVFLKSIK